MNKKYECIGCVVIMQENIERLKFLCESSLKNCEIYKCAINDPRFPYRSVVPLSNNLQKMETALLECVKAHEAYVRMVKELED